MRAEFLRYTALLITLLATLTAPGGAQVDWGDATWRIEAADHELERFAGRDALRLTNGTAWLTNTSARDGVVRVDAYMSAALGFHGIAFRAVDDAGYEHVYVRPFVSGQPDASQYTPVFNGVTGWQIYAGAGYGGAVEVPVDRWVRLELRFRDGRAEFSVDGEVVAIPRLERTAAVGAIGLTSSGAAARFADPQVHTDPPTLATDEVAHADSLPAGIVRHWRVSTTFDEAELDPLADLDPTWTGTLEWDSLAAGTRGVANLARLRTRSATANTVFAATTLHADEARRVRVRFGFSDRVRVYLNGVPIYHGADVWRSRDYKFLGTVGLFDELVLPLRAGPNEVWLAVSEDFGGWGVTMEVRDGR